jgi:uncharacterized protein with FMN-binding domain
MVLAVAVLGVLIVYAARSDDKTARSSAAQLVKSSGNYHDGTFKGMSAKTSYGTVRVEVKIRDGRIADVKTLEMPGSHPHSKEISRSSAPLLKKNVLKSQSADIDFVSGATITSYGYQQSLQAALDKAARSSVIYKNIKG